jgi:prepilin peptidase CpaA
MTFHLLLSAAFLIFPAGMAFAASMDLLTMTIPNRLCLALALGFFLFALVSSAPLHLVLWNVSCGVAVLVVMFTLFSLGWIGGGDAKFAAATALWIGWGSMLDYSLSAAIYGGVLTVILILARRAPLPERLAKLAWLARLHHPKTGVPYGIALAAAGMMIFPQTALIHAAVMV